MKKFNITLFHSARVVHFELQSTPLNLKTLVPLTFIQIKWKIARFIVKRKGGQRI